MMVGVVAVEVLLVDAQEAIGVTVADIFVVGQENFHSTHCEETEIHVRHVGILQAGLLAMHQHIQLSQKGPMTQAIKSTKIQ